ncbi:MAG: PAS domain-containing sensor histidine kinase [Gemmatimonadota bacterium]
MTESFDALPMSDAMLAGMVAISADAIIAVDSGHTIVFFNAGAEQTFGYTAAEAIGMPLNALLPQRFRDVHSQHVERFGTSHEAARRMGERRQISGLRRSGDEFPAEASIARVHADGRVAYTVVLRDMTARQRIEQELRVAIESRDQMAGIVSHDLRNPVQAVKMLTSAILLREGTEAVPTEVAEHVQTIRRAADQMDALIGDLADVTRIEAGQLRVHPEPCDAGVLLRAAADAMIPLANGKGQTLSTEVDDALPPVMADVRRILQVLSNVVGNAIKFSPAGSEIRLSAAAQDERRSVDGRRYVEFAVRDFGPGIPEASLPHVFNRYYQSANAVRPGSGLGLTIARGIVEAHGGLIEVESAEGVGTTARFALPIAEAMPN